MRRVKVYVDNKWASHLLSAWITSIMAMAHLGLGLAVILGGEKRFVLPTYQPLVDMVDGNTWLWGVSIALSAVLMITPFRWPIIIGLWIGMFWMLMWTAAFTVSVLRFENAAATPIPVYGAMALINIALLTARVLDEKTE